MLLLALLFHVLVLTNAWLPPPTIGTLGTTAAAGLVGGLVAATTSRKDVYTPETGSLVGQTILVTGATTGMGLESACRLAVGNPSRLVLTARSDDKGREAIDRVQVYLRSKNLNSEQTKIDYILLDLDDLESVRLAVASLRDLLSNNVEQQQQLDSPPLIDVLLNNAGIMALPKRELTVDGFERQIQSNHLGHFLLTALLADSELLDRDARIINVSSTAHTVAASSGGLDLDYLWRGEPSYGDWKSYGQSKLANILFTRELQRRVDESDCNWKAYTLHPGVVATDLGRYIFGPTVGSTPLGSTASALAKTVLKSPEEGATTQIFLASTADTDSIPGGSYCIDSRPVPLAGYAKDEMAAQRLWEESENKVGMKFRI